MKFGRRHRLVNDLSEVCRGNDRILARFFLLAVKHLFRYCHDPILEQASSYKCLEQEAKLIDGTLSSEELDLTVASRTVQGLCLAKTARYPSYAGCSNGQSSSKGDNNGEQQTL